MSASRAVQHAPQTRAAVIGPRPSARLARNLHPVAWWLWALGLVVAASRTTNPILLLGIVGVATIVVFTCRSDAPWARAFHYYLVFGAFIVVFRVVFRIVFGGGAVGDHIWFTLPTLPLPSWAAGVTIGGPVTAEAVVAAAVDGLRLATIIVCIGAANALANPKRALRVLPGALYELGVAVVISITVAPQLLVGIQRVRRARRLRGGAQRGFSALRSIALPVLQDALDRSLALAAAMDCRGYGRRGDDDPGRRRVTAALLIGGLAALCAGSYGMLGGSASPGLVLGSFGIGVALCITGLTVGSRRVHHTGYRPDPWDVPESLVAGAGLLVALGFVVAARADPGALLFTATPLGWPPVPTVPLLMLAIAATPVFTAPPRPAVVTGPGLGARDVKTATS